MNSNDIVKTAIKVFGLYFLILTVIDTRDIIFMVTGAIGLPHDNYGTYMIVGGPIYRAIFNFTFGLILIFKTDWITAKIKSEKTGELKLSLDKADWIEISIIVISTLTIIYSIPEFFQKIVYYVYFNDYEKVDRHLYWTGKNKADVFYSVFKFVVGLFFLLNARNISRRLTKMGDKEEN